nr:MAG TPA: hypothetical protein [Caudoviricetes sp.]
MSINSVQSELTPAERLNRIFGNRSINSLMSELTPAEKRYFSPLYQRLK